MTREEELRRELGLEETADGNVSGDSDDENVRPNNPPADVASWRQKLQEQIALKEDAQKEKMRIISEMESMRNRQKEELASIRQMSRSQLQILKTTIQKRDARIAELKREVGDTSPEEDAAQSLITPRVFQTPRIPDTARSGAGTEYMGISNGSDSTQVQQLQSELATLRNTNDSLMEANAKLQASTRGKLSAMEKELALARSGNANGVASEINAGSSEEVKKLGQQVLQLKKALQEAQAKADEYDQVAAELETSKQNVENMKAKCINLKQQLEQASSTQSAETTKQLQDKDKMLRDLEQAYLKEKDARQKEQQKNQAMPGMKKSIKKLHNDLKHLKKNYRELQTLAAQSQRDVFPTLRDFFQKIAKELMRVSRVAAVSVEKYKKEAKERKRLHNMIVELKGNIRVFCRVRPLNEREKQSGHEPICEYPSENEIVVYNEQQGTTKLFEFDQVFDPTKNQSDVFEDVEPLATSVLDGYNVCIFAYGQTGSGKTYTMEGPASDKGVNTRCLARLFEVLKERAEDYRYTITLSMLEIYNENIRDLLDAGNDRLEVRQNPDGKGVYVEGLAKCCVANMEETQLAMSSGAKNRATFSTNSNEHSSRSHSVISVHVEGESLMTGQSTYGKLHLIDLAGSERVSKSEVQGERLKEAQAINKSLSALGDVIQALSAKSSHVPFRNSKLTHLLSDSLGGDSKCLMFCQVSPTTFDSGETLCSLNFAARARNVELGKATKHTSGPRAPTRPQSASAARR
jgi:kinesin family protein C2/C3